MDKRLKAFVFAAVAHWLLCVMAIVARSRKRKRVAIRKGITYAPMFERDRKRIEYLNDKIWRNDTTCVTHAENEQSTFLSVLSVV